MESKGKYLVGPHRGGQKTHQSFHLFFSRASVTLRETGPLTSFYRLANLQQCQTRSQVSLPEQRSVLKSSLGSDTVQPIQIPDSWTSACGSHSLLGHTNTANHNRCCETSSSIREVGAEWSIASLSQDRGTVLVLHLFMTATSASFMTI